MKVRIIALGVAVGLACTMARAQSGTADRKFYPEDLRKDLRVLRQTIEQSHPDPYRYLTRSEMDLMFQSLDTSLEGPLTAEEFIQAVLPVLRAMGDANTRLQPPAVLSNSYDHTEPLIPLTVAVLGGRLYVDQELKGFRTLPSGSEILQINGRPAAKVLALMRGLLVPEGEDTTRLDRIIENEFPRLYRRAVERADAFDIVYKLADGTTRDNVVMAMSRDQMRRSTGQRGFAPGPWRMEELRDTKLGWLTLSTLDRKSLKEQRLDPGKFLNSVRNSLNKDGLTSLVIDLRGAGGDDLDLAQEVFALIAQRPYRCIRTMSVRNGNVPDPYKYAQPAPEFYASLETAYLPESNGRMSLKADDPRLQLVAPRDKAFTGKVYVICDGLTTDAAAAFVMMAKRSHRAKIVGEETGSNATSYCGGQDLHVTLPRTECVLHMPLMRYVPDGEVTGSPARGEMPDHKVVQSPEGLALGRDMVRTSMIELIDEMR